MNFSIASSDSRRQGAPIRSVRLRRIALPTEHGGWAFLGEPLFAGLSIAFSPTALWIVMMTIGIFLLRQPLRVLIADRMGRRDGPVAAASIWFALLYAGLFTAGLAGTIKFSGTGVLAPFLIVLPLIAVQVYFDIFRRSRAVVPEIAGAISISSSVAAIALAGGFHWQFAAVLWFVLIARLVPSILYVRERLRLEKGKAHSLPIPIAAHIAALLLVVFLAFFGLIPVITSAAMIILLFRAITGLSATRRKMRAMQIGIWEVVYGIMTVVILIIGYHAGL